MTEPYQRAFVLEIDGRAIVAFHAQKVQDARNMCREEWLRDDINALTSNGAPILTAKSKLRTRVATNDESAILEAAAKVQEDSEEMVLAYLVDIDHLK